MSIKAIPTTYNGIKMRSKLEASFAQALDSFGIEWVYEAEGFDIDGVWYLPDFWVPKFESFVEVKGVLDDSVEKPRKLSGMSCGRRVFLATPEHVQSWVATSRPRLLMLGEHTWSDQECHFAKCRVCGLSDLHSSKHCLRVYFAGKVRGPKDWRHQIVPSLRGAFQPEEGWPSLEISRAAGGRHVYTGPFFQSVQTELGHFMDMSWWKHAGDTDSVRNNLFQQCKEAIANSEMVFAWIDDATAYGTIFEIGYANAIGKPVYAAGPETDNEDLWFPLQACGRVYRHTDDEWNALHTSASDAFHAAVDDFRRDHDVDGKRRR